MFDADLAIRVMNKIGKELVNVMAADNLTDARAYAQKALNEQGLLYDVLHLGPEWNDIPHSLQVIDINH